MREKEEGRSLKEKKRAFHVFSMARTFLAAHGTRHCALVLQTVGTTALRLIDNSVHPWWRKTRSLTSPQTRVPLSRVPSTLSCYSSTS